jgi:hypothetical protein
MIQTSLDDNILLDGEPSQRDIYKVFHHAPSEIQLLITFEMPISFFQI